VEYGYVLHGGTLLPMPCGIVSGGIKNEAIELGKNILQILAHMVIYSPQRKCMYQEKVVIDYLISFRDGNNCGHT
jgi:hypothetical protein